MKATVGSLLMVSLTLALLAAGAMMLAQSERELDVCESGRAADKIRLEAAAVELEQCSQRYLP